MEARVRERIAKAEEQQAKRIAKEEARGVKKEKVKKEKVVKETHTEITCMDCGVTRSVKVQDRFQVKRCVECQKKHSRQQRKEYRKNRVRRLRERISFLEMVLTEKGVDEANWKE